MPKSIFGACSHRKNITMLQCGRKLRCVSVFLCLLVVSASASKADTTALTVTSVGAASNVGNYSLGWRFTANSSVTVDQLGYWDQGLDGFASPHQVGLYDLAGNLLTSTTVASSDPLTADFRYHATSSYTLTAGDDYYLMGVAGSDNYIYNASISTDPAVTYVAGEYNSVADGTLKSPDLANSNIYLGPNFKYTTSAVPEASTASTFFAAMFVVGACSFNRRNLKRKSAPISVA